MSDSERKNPSTDSTINRYDLIDVDHDNALLVISFQAASTSGDAPL
jgi:hypothetical protein